MIAAQLLTGPRAIRTLVMRGSSLHPSIPSLSVHNLAEPTAGITGCHHAQRRRITGYRRKRYGSCDGRRCAPDVVDREPAFATVARRPNAVAGALGSTRPPGQDLDFGAVGQ